MNLMLLCFMHGIINGPEKAVSITSIDQWKIHFAQNILEYCMTACIKLYYSNFSKNLHVSNFVDSLSTNQRNQRKTENFTILYYDKISFKDISFRNSELILAIMYTYSLKFVVERAVYGKSSHDYRLKNVYSEDDIKNLVLYFSEKKIFSKKLFDRLAIQDVAYIFWKKLYFSDVMFLKAIYDKMPIDDKDPMKYLWTRDHLNLFDLTMISSLNGNPKDNVAEMIAGIFSVSNPGLVQFDAFRKLIRSGLSNFQSVKNFNTLAIDESLVRCLKIPILFQIIMDELPLPANFFKSCSSLLNRIMEIPKETIKIYIQGLDGNDPLPILFFLFIFDHDNLNYFLSGKRFNLNRRYIFDKNFTIENFCPLINLNKVYNPSFFANGRIMTFRQIVQNIAIDLIRFDLLFSVRAEENNDDLDQSAPISISQS